MTEETRSILELVRSTGERYGIVAVCDGVHGAKTEKVRQFGLEENPYYGELKGTTTARIRQIINDLLIKDYLVLTSGDYPVLKLGREGQGVSERGKPGAGSAEIAKAAGKGRDKGLRNRRQRQEGKPDILSFSRSFGRNGIRWPRKPIFLPILSFQIRPFGR